MLFSLCDPYRLVCEKIQITFALANRFSGQSFCLSAQDGTLQRRQQNVQNGFQGLDENSFSVKKPTYILKVLQAFQLLPTSLSSSLFFA